MSKFVTALSAGIVVAVLVCGPVFLPTPARAASDADKAAMKHATETCRAQVTEQAQYHEMSWVARHKAVKDCVKQTLGH